MGAVCRPRTEMERTAMKMSNSSHQESSCRAMKCQPYVASHGVPARCLNINDLIRLETWKNSRVSVAKGWSRKKNKSKNKTKREVERLEQAGRQILGKITQIISVGVKVKTLQAR